MTAPRTLWPRWYSPLADKRPSIRYLTLRASDVTGIEVEKIKSRSRYPTVSTARHAIWLVAARAGFSRHQIGSVFGRNHTTVTHGVREANYRETRDKAFRDMVREIGR